ncbi:hypothetical protein [Candidatus Neoehrlichia procyonis]|uniref:Uncharacterized protein n=1 Tax=Candidatus Neoehrlichia procyonis str. RAC413 TaxID=1359163 RepID=A0A0F3NM61_9RICK|nr:hypothetical protein [Candidatus Neoehrlichia lotoris]KJV68792.1 hypothetical protein NLO413_0157 [Candidatus Neoehrlichia lotoris str. RAC413]
MITLSNLAYKHITELIINNYFKHDVKYNTTKIIKIHDTLREFLCKDDAEYIATFIAKTIHKRIFGSTIAATAYLAYICNTIKHSAKDIGDGIRASYDLSSNMQEYYQQINTFLVFYSLAILNNINTYLQNNYTQEISTVNIKNELSNKLFNFVHKQIYKQCFLKIVLTDAIKATNIFNTTKQLNGGLPFISIKKICKIVSIMDIYVQDIAINSIWEHLHRKKFITIAQDAAKIAHSKYNAFSPSTHVTMHNVTKASSKGQMHFNSTQL